MNYYEHHIGDYAEATSHLSILEDGVYSRLLRKMYSTERSLPLDKKLIHRLIGAKSSAEKKAVDVVLEEFFFEAADGYHNKRVDQEIARFQDKQSKARNSANARWNVNQPQTERNADASPNAMRTHSEGNALQTPDTRHQTPVLKQTQDIGAVTQRSVAPPTPPHAPGNPATTAGLACKAIREAGIADTNPSHPKLIALIDAGATPQEFGDTARELFSKDKKNFAYVIGTMTRRREEAKVLVLHQGAMPNPQRNESERDRKRRETYENLTGKGGKSDEPIDITSTAERVG